MSVFQYAAGGLVGFGNQIAGTKYGGMNPGPANFFGSPSKVGWLGGTFRGGGGIMGMWDRLSSYMGVGYENPWASSWGVEALTAMKGQGRYYRSVSGGAEMFGAAPFLRRNLRIGAGANLGVARASMERQAKFAEGMQTMFGRRRWGVGIGAGALAIGAGATLGYGNLFQMGIGAGVGAVGGAFMGSIGGGAFSKIPILGRGSSSPLARTRIAARGAKAGAAFGAAAMGLGMLTGLV